LVNAGIFGSECMSWFINLTTRNKIQAMMIKLITVVRKFPHDRTAPCFLASTSESAVTFDYSGMK